MVHPQLHGVLRHLRSMRESRAASEASDAQLLEWFTHRREEGPFTALVRRHGPMVWSVSRRVLSNAQDAEDVFQATFLLLARKAASIRKRDSLSCWLHGVAYRLALKTRQQQTRRQAREKRAADRRTVQPNSELIREDLQAALDQALEELPEKYRAALVLCYLEGKSHAEAAQQLGYPLATLRTHIARGRKLLRDRLTTHGLTLSAPGVASLLLASAAPAGAPAALAKKTITAALAFAAGRSTATLCSSHAARLAEGGSQTMFSGKVKVAITILVALGIAAAASGLGSSFSSHDDAKPQANAKPQAATTRRQTADDVREVSGQVLRPDGQPMSGAKVWYATAKQEHAHLATTDADGQFHCKLPAAETDQKSIRQLVVQADGFGPDWISLRDVAPNRPLTLHLAKAEVAIHGRVVTLEGKPVKGATLTVRELATTPDKADLSSVFKGWNLDPFMALRVASKVLHCPAAAGLPNKVKTDAEGRFDLKGVGDQRLLTLRIEDERLEHTLLIVATAAGFDAKSLKNPQLPLLIGSVPPLYGPSFSHAGRPTYIVAGVVRDQKTGEPIRNVRAVGAVANGWEESVTSTKTDAKGRYELVGLPVGPECRVTFIPPQDDSPYLPLAKKIEYSPDKHANILEMELVHGVVVAGRITDKEAGQPVQARVRYAPLQGNDELKKLPGKDVHANGDWGEIRTGNGVSYFTDAAGRFRFVAPAGLGVVLVRSTSAKPYTQVCLTSADLKKPYTVNAPELGPTQMFMRADELPELLLGRNAYQVINPAAGTESLTLDFQLDPGKTAKGRVLDPEGKPLTGVVVIGLRSAQDEIPENKLDYLVGSAPAALESESFTARALDPEHPGRIAFIHTARKLAAVISLRGDEKEAHVVRMQPWGAVKGQVVDADGSPVSGATVGVGFRTLVVSHLYNAQVQPKTEFFQVDKDGRFQLDIPFADEPFSIVVLSKQGKPLDQGGRYDTWTVAPGKVKEIEPIKVLNAN